MINPYIGVLLNGRYYGYVPDSYSESLPLRNQVFETQSNRTVSVLGKSKESFTLTLSVDSEYDVYAGSSFLGTTSWVGVSRLVDLKSYIGTGVSLPIDFITPYGGSFSVVPVGELNVSIFNPDNPKDSVHGMEFRVTLTLENVG